ncbi:MAG: methyltransferase domain-containing protein [Chloroflexota bacterium]|nr:methyltransferase domain-containing protein [Chloroflexota bacterium]
MTISLFPVPRRSERLEKLDLPARHLGHLGPGMGEVRRVNRWLGGVAIALGFLQRRPELSPGARASLLDIGTGTADIPLVLSRWGRRAGVNLDIVATDISPEVLALARDYVHERSGVRLEVADATHLPYEDSSFDYVMANMALHHFQPEAAAQVLREMHRVARHALLVNDLHRSRTGYWAARLLFLTTTRNPVTRHDGPLSVLRAYTTSELAQLAVAAGLTSFRVRRRAWFRVELIAEKRG